MTTSENTPQVSDSNDTSAPRAVDWENPRVAAILAAAAKCFSRKGFSATTLAEIGKELGLRKSIVHYYFASKAALIHEVQSYTYRKYLDRVKEAIASVSADEPPTRRARRALESLWEAIQHNETAMGLNIEVWSASRRDEELKRRAATLHHDARELIRESIGDVIGSGAEKMPLEPLSTLILAVLNGLAVHEFLEDDQEKAKQAYDTFIYLLRLGIKDVESQGAG